MFQRLKIVTDLHILDKVYALLSLYVSSQIDGEPYWYYEYLIRKSPNSMVSISSWCIFFFYGVCDFYFGLVTDGCTVWRIRNLPALCCFNSRKRWYTLSNYSYFSIANVHVQITLCILMWIYPLHNIAWKLLLEIYFFCLFPSIRVILVPEIKGKIQRKKNKAKNNNICIAIAF